MATPAEISEASPCFSCINDKLSALLYLLNQIRIEGGGDDMTPDEIAEASACFACINDRETAILYLLGQLVAGSGVGGGGQILEYTTTGPTADGLVPDTLNKPAIAVKPGGSTFTWDPTLHVWDDV